MESATEFLRSHYARLRDRDEWQFDDYRYPIEYWYNRSGKTEEQLRESRSSWASFAGRYDQHTLTVREATRRRVILQSDVTREYPTDLCRAFSRFYVLEATPEGWVITGEMDGANHNAYPQDATPLPDFFTTHCGAVFDFDDGLEWYVSAALQATSREAESIASATTTCCAVETFGNDAWLWRVPTETEARTLFDGTRDNPVAADLNGNAFWLKQTDGPLGLFEASTGTLRAARGSRGGVLLVRWTLDD